jgi:hypothetical protein
MQGCRVNEHLADAYYFKGISSAVTLIERDLLVAVMVLVQLLEMSICQLRSVLWWHF